MTAPQHRRPLPAVALIAVLTVLTAIVWIRVLDRGDGSGAAGASTCTTPRATPLHVLPYTRNVSVIVLNSTDRANLAAHTRAALQKDYFHVVAAANDEPSYGGHGEISGVGEIRYGPVAAAAATTLHYFVPGATMVRTDSSSATVILSLGKEFTALPSRTDSIALMKQHHITQTTASPTPVPAPTPSC